MTTTSPRDLPDNASAATPVSIEVVYRQILSGAQGWVRAAEGGRTPLPAGRYLGGRASTPEDRFADSVLLRLCTGPTVDLGCGPGRFTAALAARGLPALGVDSCAAAVQMTARRGGVALHRDVFGALPGIGGWTRVLLADGNIGIGGDPVGMLARARDLLAPNGVIVAEVDSPRFGLRRDQRRWETEHSTTEWFPWAQVGTDACIRLAKSVGLRVVTIIEVSGRYIVTLRMN